MARKTLDARVKRPRHKIEDDPHRPGRLVGVRGSITASSTEPLAAAATAVISSERPETEGVESVPKLRFRLVPRDESFYELFVRLASKVQEAGEAYQDLIVDYDEVGRKAERLRDLEHEGDEVTHEIMKRLNTVFVTPLDHEDIHRLASGLDDVVDHIEAAADLFVLHKIEQPLPEMKSQADVLVRACIVTREALETLPRFKALEPHWVEVNRLENEGDRIYRRAVAGLFGGDHKAMDVLKWKDIIDEAEQAIDKLEDVSNMLEAIALKHA